MENKKTVLVTGASRGIGRAIALSCATAGYTVIAHYNKGKAEAESLQAEILAQNGQARLIQFDITNRTATRVALEELCQNTSLWGVVHNAGITSDDTFAALSEESWDRVIDTDLNSFYNVLHPLVMPMARKKKGRIITLSSVSGLVGNRGQVNYSAAKAGIIGASKALAIELASRSITVNCIAPGFIETDMTKEAPIDHILPLIPMARAGKASEVAALALFLLSEEAGYITRQVISVNGGLT